MVRMPAGLGTGLVGGCGVGTAPDTGSGDSEPPPSPQAVKTATVASTRGREITGTPKLSGTPSLGLSRELAHAIHRHATCPLPSMGTTGTFRPLLGVSTCASQRMVPGMVRRWELEGDKYARMIQLVQRQLKRGWSTGSFFKVILVSTAPTDQVSDRWSGLVLRQTDISRSQKYCFRFKSARSSLQKYTDIPDRT